MEKWKISHHRWTIAKTVFDTFKKQIPDIFSFLLVKKKLEDFDT